MRCLEVEREGGERERGGGGGVREREGGEGEGETGIVCTGSCRRTQAPERERARRIQPDTDALHPK